MKFETDSRLSSAQAAQFNSAWQAAQSHAQQQPATARKFLVEALAIDSEHAGVNYLMGRLAWEAGQFDEARSLLVRAKDNDVCPLRALSSMQTAVQELARQAKVPLLDADQIFSERSPDGLVGHKWLVDHVHPNIEGHQLLGERLCELILEQRWLTEQDSDWRANRPQRWRAHLSSLREDYFQRGKQRLEGLMLWTQGRAKKVTP